MMFAFQMSSDYFVTFVVIYVICINSWPNKIKTRYLEPKSLPFIIILFNGWFRVWLASVSSEKYNAVTDFNNFSKMYASDAPVSQTAVSHTTFDASLASGIYENHYPLPRWKGSDLFFLSPLIYCVCPIINFVTLAWYVFLYFQLQNCDRLLIFVGRGCLKDFTTK